jgi:hypothetical protein
VGLPHRVEARRERREAGREVRVRGERVGDDEPRDDDEDGAGPRESREDAPATREEQEEREEPDELRLVPEAAERQPGGGVTAIAEENVSEKEQRDRDEAVLTIADGGEHRDEREDPRSRLVHPGPQDARSAAASSPSPAAVQTRYATPYGASRSAANGRAKNGG